ncbi:MAG: glycosyltransferase family 39 protein [Bacteroidota bacterium]
MRIISAATRAALFLIGLFILLTLIPHDSPWRLSNISRTMIDGDVSFIINLGVVPSTFILSTRVTFLAVIILLILVIAALPRKELGHAWQSFKRHARAFAGGLIAFDLFVLTLMPAELDFVRDGTSVTFYLVVSSLALAILLITSAPAILSLYAKLAEPLQQAYQSAKRIVLSSSPFFYVGALAVTGFALANFLSYTLFEHIPHVQDSIAQAFHGKIFAQGALVAPAPPWPPDFFNFLHMIIREGRWYSQYPPGHSVLLAAGYLINAPWIINPLFGSLTIVAAYALGKELFDETAGRIAAALTLISPFIFFMSSEFMNHTTALFFFAIFILFFAKSLRTGSLLHGLIAGGALGWLANIRPYSAPALAAPFLLYGLFVMVKHWPDVRRAVVGFTAAFSVFIGLLLAFNWITNGDPFLFGFQVLWGDKVQPGFGQSGWGEVHTPFRGLQQTLSNLNGLNKYLFELPIPSLFLVVPLFLTGKHNRWDYLLIGSFVLLNTAYFFYWFQDWCFGPRFLFEASVPLILIVARGIQHFPSLWNDVFGFRTERMKIRILSLAGLGFLFALGFATNLPPHIQFYGQSYWGVNTDVIKAVKEVGIKKGIIFVKSYYGSSFPQNDPFLKSPIIYATDLQEDNQILMKRFPDYPAYRAIGSRLEPIAAK